MPMLVVSWSRNVVCSVVNALIDASSMIALTWFSNRTGSTITFCGIALNSAEPIGTASTGMSEMRMRRLSSAHWPIRPSPRRVVGG